LTPSIRFTIWKSTCAVTGELVAASHIPRQNWSTEMTAAVTPAAMTSREPVSLAKAIAITAMPTAGSPSVSAYCTASAGPCPPTAETICAPEALNFGLGAGTVRPAIQDSV
jgi:hypothetical protein